jgi:integration host factor subunit alpha
MTTTKASLIEEVFQKVGLTKKTSVNIIETVFEIMKDKLGTGEKITISGFGNFVVREKGPRIGRNPKTGEEMVITPRRVLTFKLSQMLKREMNPS